MGPGQGEQGLSLYRRWRPLRFSDVVGQELVVHTLQRAVSMGKTAHAFLFSGQRGVGKTSVARILARAVNCLSVHDGEPCNACESCVRILSGASLDVVEVDGASNRGIDHIRQLREQVGYVPAAATRKVYIIDEVHMLTGEAFNALLKTLEEPPPRVLFILATTEPHKVPLTVLSRCQSFEFSPLGADQIAHKIMEIARNEGLEVETQAAQLIARRSGGSLRDAEVLLEQLAHSSPITQHTVQELLGLPPEDVVDSFVSSLASGEAQGPLAAVAELTSRGRDVAVFLEEAAARARDRIIAGESQLIPVARALVAWRAELPRAVSRRLHVELGILELCGPSVAETNADNDTSSSPPPPPITAPPEPRADDPTWQPMLADCYRRSRALAAFLLPARQYLADGVLRIVLPADCRFHYDSLQEAQVRSALEEIAHKHFGALLGVHIEREGHAGEEPSLEERAALAAEVLEGEIMKEQSA